MISAGCRFTGSDQPSMTIITPKLLIQVPLRLQRYTSPASRKIGGAFFVPGVAKTHVTRAETLASSAAGNHFYRSFRDAAKAAAPVRILVAADEVTFAPTSKL